ncbi:MAG: hypothetical protein J7L38_01730 [Thermoproteales archaeon]|nr:hypothetical protein [Thermoproteales archaeon]
MILSSAFFTLEPLVAKGHVDSSLKLALHVGLKHGNETLPHEGGFVQGDFYIGDDLSFGFLVESPDGKPPLVVASTLIVRRYLDVGSKEIYVDDIGVIRDLKGLQGSLNGLLIKPQSLYFRLNEFYRLAKDLYSSIEFKKFSVSELLPLVYNLTGLETGSFTLILKGTLLLEVFNGWSIETYTTEHEFLKTQVFYRDMEVVNASIGSWDPHITLQFKTYTIPPAVLNRSRIYAKALLAATILFIIVGLFRRKFKRKHLHYTVFMLGLVLIFSALIVQIGTRKTSMVIVLAKNIKVDGMSWPTATANTTEYYFSSELKKGEVEIQVLVIDYNNYPFAVNGFVDFYKHFENESSWESIKVGEKYSLGIGLSPIEDKLSIKEGDNLTVVITATLRKLGLTESLWSMKDRKILSLNYSNGMLTIKYEPVVEFNEGIVERSWVKVVFAVTGTLLVFYGALKLNQCFRDTLHTILKKKITGII